MRSGERRPATIEVTIGKKLSHAAISALGTSPVKPMLPKTTTTIGATASAGTV